MFHHTLIQEVAYASMLRGRRRLIHLRYAEALERDPTGPAAAAPELLAAHFGRAGMAEKSIDYYLKAAQRATGRFALAEIVGYLQKGLDQIGGLPATASILRKELILRIELGRALMEHRGAGDEEVRSNMERAQALCIDLGETEKLLQVHDGLSNHHFARSQFDKLLECAEQALELGNRVGNPQAVVVARRTSGYARLVLGRFHEAREDFAQALAGYGGAMATTRDPKVSVCAGLGLCLTALGLPDSGTEVSLAGVRHAEALRHPASLNIGLRRACTQAMMRRDVPRVQDLSRRLLASQNDYETFRGVREGAFFTAWAEWQADPDPAVSKRLLATLDYFESERHLDLLTFYMVATAELMEADGDREQASDLLRRAAGLVRRTGERWCEAEIPRLQARLTGDRPAAIRLLEASLAISHRQGALLWELRAAADLAKLLIAGGRAIDADRVLSPVLARVTEGEAMQDVCSARRLLGQLQTTRH